ncbi:hypothetical protein Pyn_05505 [Prunus yedoensis var. nudiflora]|uniref:Pectinesterase inhibitor domain-containing protein n=1 Tax=Prunus yedoensis var. nudiflora TaxID=2094558 RepID=A0A314Z193_PRUYE|nr:hypothetical protein Pyn_05505 [Prunus yedoensis var. nudiflora]
MVSSSSAICCAIVIVASFSIELAGKQADQNLETFRELSHNATAAKMKEEFDACVRFYKQVRPQIQAAHLLSQKRQYENNSALLQANEFALRCSLGISIDSLEINQLQESVLLKLDTSISVNRYVALAQLKGCSLK